MKNKFFINNHFAALLATTLFFGFTAAMASDEPTAENECRRNPPGLRASDMIEAGFVVQHLENGSYTYVRLDYVYPDRMYYRYQGNTWRVLYVAHPSSVVHRPRIKQPVICGYVIGFRINQSDEGSTKPEWAFIQDVDFVETP